MKKIGFLGCGKIGGFLLNHVVSRKDSQAVFIQDPFFTAPSTPCPIIKQADPLLYQSADLIVESATSEVLKADISMILTYCDLLMFSVTAFSDENFEQEALDLCKRYDRQIYLPHGAILGLDGLYDAKSLLRSVRITTTKSPQSLGLPLQERTVVYEGSTREACRQFPRNVNVHATVALAGLGFDQTFSRIIADPIVTTNSHLIEAHGSGVNFTIQVASTASEGVTGTFTPVSACGSLERVLEERSSFSFV